MKYSVNAKKFTAKKLTALFISVLMLISLMPMTALADNVVAEGQCGDAAYWKITENGENKILTVYGTGDMWERTQWTGNDFDAWDITKLVIEHGITSIADQAFGKNYYFSYNSSAQPEQTSFGGYFKEYGSYHIKPFKNIKGDLIIPDSVTSIGCDAFYDCSKLTGGLIIPNSVKSIGECAFGNCSGFDGNLVIPNSVTSIGDSAFINCSGFIGDLVIPDSVTSIGSSAFRSCSGFNGSLVLPNTITSIKELTFEDCNGFTGNLVIPNSVTSIENRAFNSCNGFNGNLVLPNSLTAIGDSAFCYCSGFTGNLAIPNSVTSIGESAFYYCLGFTGNLVIPNSVTSIGESAFSYCSGLDGTLTLSTSLKSIGRNAFINCSGLTGDLVIPNSVTSIGMFAFGYCSGFNGNLTLSDSIENIFSYTFFHCSGFKGNLVITDSVKSIGDCAFEQCAGFNGTLTIGKKVEAIGNRAFMSCSGLKGSLVIPDSVTSIGESAFEDCSGFNGTLTLGNNLRSINKAAFWNCCNLTGTLVIPDSMESPETGAFDTGAFCFAASNTNGSSTFYGKLEDCNTYKFFEHYRGDSPDDKYQFAKIVEGERADPSEASDGYQVYYIYAVRYYKDNYYQVATVIEPIYYIPHDTHTPGTPVQKEAVYDTSNNVYEFKLVTYCEEGSEKLGEETVSLTRTPGIDAIPGQDGNIEYFTDEDGNKYIWFAGGVRYLPYDGSTVAHIHEFRETYYNPSCTTRGHIRYNCIYCDYSYDSYFSDIIPDQHNWSEWITIPATCTVKGQTKRVCLNGCGATETKDLGYAAHIDNNKDGNCDVCGLKVCKWCGEHHDTSNIREWFVAFIHYIRYIFSNLIH